MRNTNLRFFLSAVSLASIWLAFVSSVEAAPVQFNQVVQVINAKPGKANTGSFSNLRLADDPIVSTNGDDDTPKPQDDRVITETKVEIVEDDVCECNEPYIETRGGFPKWTLLGLGAIPLVFLVKNGDDPTPTPTTPTTPTATPTTTPTTTPTATPTPPITPTPTPPEPVPEPITILLFGTGLAGVGLAARKKFGKKENKEN
ncbi:MAG TPA: PEP-CTERM sorting domain-containing protein [Pyrinomonadaceae bacterium]|nr:PEP-CTERM sorting domain-containing protein [Pyrinomonadaceae bacterium]